MTLSLSFVVHDGHTVLVQATHRYTLYLAPHPHCAVPLILLQHLVATVTSLNQVLAVDASEGRGGVVLGWRGVVDDLLRCQKSYCYAEDDQDCQKSC